MKADSIMNSKEIRLLLWAGCLGYIILYAGDMLKIGISLLALPLLPDVPHCQVVFTIPKMLRIFYKYNRRLLDSLCRSALRSLTQYFEVATGNKLMPGVIAAIQTFGDRIHLHPHLHFLVTEGGVDGVNPI